jgi:hypothetical protein
MTAREPAPNNEPATRAKLASACRNKNRRSSAFSRTAPTEWTPGKVTNPETDLPFDAISAWHHVAVWLEEGHPIQCVVLDHPPGAAAYIMRIPLGVTGRSVYVKLQLTPNGDVHGRSFHYCYGTR